jgi:hypothetical protein
MSDMSVKEQMDISIEDAIAILNEASYSNSPTFKIQQVRRLIKELESFDTYWSETFDNIPRE